VRATSALSAESFEESRAKFSDDARVLARFRHPGIVEVYAVWEGNNTVYLAMELLQGRTFAQILSERGRPLDEVEVLSAVRQASEALREVHAAGLLHRDLKPDNLMQTDDGRVVLIDFGAAKELSNGPRTQAHSVVVTPGYAPLEQYAQRARRGAYTDIYALCATLYHLLTNQIPPAASDRAVGVELTPIRALNSRVSEKLAAAIESGLEIEIAKRPQNIEAWQAKLNEGVVDKGISPLTKVVTHHRKLLVEELEPPVLKPSSSMPSFNPHYELARQRRAEVIRLLKNRQESHSPLSPPGSSPSVSTDHSVAGWIISWVATFAIAIAAISILIAVVSKLLLG
jgi:serine/threonine protein kinase